MIDIKIILVIALAYTFTFFNGLKDGGNVIASIISSKSMKPYKALFLASAIEFVAPLVMGTAVAKTIGKGIVKETYITSFGSDVAINFISCALVGAIAWNIITWCFAIPSSSSHALVGGLLGSGIIFFGMQSIGWSVVIFKVMLMIILTPILGFIIGAIILTFFKKVSSRFTPEVNKFYKSFQVFSMFFLAVSHGTNDAQKSMGVVTLLLVIIGNQDAFIVPMWVKLGSAFFISFGMLCGGWKIVRTVGKKIYKMQPMHSLASQVSSASVIFFSGLVGSPVSTSQIVSSSIAGVGANERLSAVKWNVVKKIIISWFITVPSAAVFSITASYLFMVFTEVF